MRALLQHALALSSALCLCFAGCDGSTVGDGDAGVPSDRGAVSIDSQRSDSHTAEDIGLAKDSQSADASRDASTTDGGAKDGGAKDGSATDTVEASVELSVRPEVVDVLPDHPLAPWSTLTITFSGVMDQATLTLGGTIGAAKVLRWIDDRQVEIVPDQKWEVGPNRTLEIGAKDSSGLSIDPDPTTVSRDVRNLRSVAMGGRRPSFARVGDAFVVAYQVGTSIVVARSDDLGESWMPTASSIPGFASDPALASDGSVLYLAYRNERRFGMYSWTDLAFVKSDDSGDSWPTRVTVDPGSRDFGTTYNGRMNSIAVVESDIYIAYQRYYIPNISGSSSSWLRFAHSANSGDSWTLNAPGCANARSSVTTAIAALPGKVSIAATNDVLNAQDDRLGLAQSGDDGESWTCHDPQPATRSLASHPALSLVGGVNTTSVLLAYYSEADGDLIFARSDDGGATWGATNGFVTTVDSGGDVGQYVDIKVADDKTTVYLAYADLTNEILRFARSDDGGKTWPVKRSVHHGIDIAGKVQLDAAASSSGKDVWVVYSSYDQVFLAHSSDNGDSW